jgi:hypothetical protein
MIKYFTPTILILLQITSAHADSYDDPTCDNVCSQLVDTTDAKAMGITGADSWTSSDDAWCAANPVASTPITSATAATSENRCQYHNTQVLTYCIAYEKTQSAQGMEMPLLLLDVAGAAICGTACAGVTIPGAGGALFAACRIDSTAASAFDIYDALVLQSSDPVSRALTGVMGAAGVANLASGFMDANQNGDTNLKDFFTGATGDHDKRNACITAGILAVASGLRAFDMSHQQQSKESACTDVKNLLSNSPVIGYVTPTTNPATAVAGGSSLSGSGAVRIGTAITGQSSSKLAQQLACAAANGSGQCGFSSPVQTSAATDGGLLSSSGIGQLAAQQIGSNIPTISGSPDAGSMIKAAMNGASGDIETKIADVAKAAQQEGQKLSKDVGSYGGGAGTAQAPKTPAFGGFNFDSPATGEKKAEVQFDRTPASASGDIWHADYKGSIFQIVSSKIVESKPRVDNLDWTTPLNRALMGLPSLKATGGLK